MAFADGAAVGSQICPDRDSEEYVDLLSGVLACLPPTDTATS